MIKKQPIQYQDYMKIINHINKLRSYGVELQYRKDTLKIAVGATMATIGLLTLPLPTGSILLIAVGMSLMATGGLDIQKYKNKILKKLNPIKKIRRKFHKN